jgi:cysteinyl-tRNA synthetase
MMRVSQSAVRTAFLAVASSLGGVRAFAPAAAWAAPSRVAFRLAQCTSVRLGSSKNDEYDDFYADFNPADFENVASTSPSGGGDGYGGGGGGRGGGGGYGRGGGGGGSYGSDGHDYTRDTSRDSSNVDEGAVNALIADRLAARKTGQFEVADSIRDRLMDDFGVTVWDKDRQWRTGASRSGSGMGGRGDRFGGGGRGGGRDARGGGGRGGRPPKDFGPNGHDYFLASDAGPNTSPLSENEIHEKIAERLQCKMRRDFSRADAIQSEFESLGIKVHDGMKQWRADGETFGDYASDRGPGRTMGSRNDRNRAYEKSSHSQETDDADEIQTLVDERAEAKKTRSYDVADEIREELRRDFNVEIDDKAREWSVGGGFGMPAGGGMDRRDRFPPYEMSPSSEVSEHAGTIQGLVEQREAARKDRDYDTADDIKDELRDSYNVVVDDKRRQWSIGGEFRGGELRGSAPATFADYVRRGGGVLTEENEAVIVSLIEERNDAKRDKNFGLADSIRDRLTEEFKVRVDDRSREWMVVSDEYVMAEDSMHFVNPETKAYVEGKIKERAVAKLRKDYDTADDIRSELGDEFHVYLDDRVKEWRYEGGAEEATNASDEEEDNSDDVADFSVVAEDDETNDDEDDGEDLDAALDTALGDTAGDVDYESLTVPELKEILREAGLAVSGKKAELIERLTN